MSLVSNSNSNYENWGLKNSVHRSVGMSQLEEEKCVEFCWIIKNFSKIPTSQDFNSLVFDGGEVSKLKWYLQLCPMTKVGEIEWMSIYLTLVDDQNLGVNKIHVRFEVILYINDVPVKKSKTHNLDLLNGKQFSWGWEKFVKRPSSTENDEIKIICKITLKDTKFIHKIIDSKSRNRNEKNFEKLRSDYWKILQRNEHSDFKILVQDETFKVHKAILSARSRVFSAMFSSQMQEAQKSSVKIEDFDQKVIENMLEFIYTGKTVILKNNVQELLKISDKYDLQDLKSDCENYLIEFLLNLENCCLLLELADNFNASKLKSEATDFIIKFKKQVSLTPLFQNMIKSNKSLGVEILMAEWNFVQSNNKDDSDEESDDGLMEPFNLSLFTPVLNPTTNN